MIEGNGGLIYPTEVVRSILVIIKLISLLKTSWNKSAASEVSSSRLGELEDFKVNTLEQRAWGIGISSGPGKTREKRTLNAS